MLKFKKTMEIKTFIYAQLMDGSWKQSQPGTVRNIESITTKYIHKLEKLKYNATVTISFDCEDGRKATEKDMEFLVEANNKEEEDKIWNTIIAVENNLN